MNPITCKDCVFFAPTTYSEPVIVDTPGIPPSVSPSDTTGGECRLKAPSVDGFPSVAPDMWCGEIIAKR